MTKLSMTVNGKPVAAEAEGRTLLSQYLREGLGLTGTHIGCDTTYCGACTVQLNGAPVKSCTVLAVQDEGDGVVCAELDRAQLARVRTQLPALQHRRL